jgi:4-cresol dehydrogenase (hydroxylating)
MVQGVLAAVPGAKVYTADNRGSDPVWKWRASMMRGAIGTLPGAAPGWAGGDALTVNPLSPIDGAEALQLYALSRDVLAQHGFDYVAETNAVWRAAQHEQFLAYSDAKGAAGAVACARALVEAQNAAGFGQWTAGPDVADVAHAAYGGAQGPLAVLNSRIKSALDPNALFVAA